MQVIAQAVSHLFLDIADEFQGARKILRVGRRAHRNFRHGPRGPGAIDQITPARVQVGLGPLSPGALRAGIANDQVAQHTAKAQHDEALVEAVVEALWLSQDLCPPIVDRRQDIRPQHLHRNRIHQAERRWPGQRNAILAHRPAHHHRVAVGLTQQGAAAVIQVPQVFALALIVFEHILRKVRTFRSKLSDKYMTIRCPKWT